MNEISASKSTKAPPEDCIPCRYREDIANTIVRIRKASKVNREDARLTSMKINAVRTHDFSTGSVAILTYEEDGRMIYYGINIRKK